MVDDKLKEGVHQQNTICQDTAAVQENRLGHKKQISSRVAWVTFAELVSNQQWYNLKRGRTFTSGGPLKEYE